MSDRKTMLLATDLSARCDRPVDRALVLAKNWETKHILLHVIDSKKKTGNRKSLSETKQKILTGLPKTKTEIEIDIEFGDVSEAKANVAITRDGLRKTSAAPPQGKYPIKRSEKGYNWSAALSRQTLDVTSEISPSLDVTS